MLLGFVIAEINYVEVLMHVTKVGFGLPVLVVIYFVAFAIDSITWQLTISGVPLNFLWAYRILKLRIVGEAFNSIIPAAGMGGEPVKASMLNLHYGISLHEGAASLILARTINLIALVAFLIGGFVLMTEAKALSKVYEYIAGFGLLALSVGVSLFFVIQRFSVASLTSTWISRLSIGRKFDAILFHIYDIDARIVRFYAKANGRFAATLLLALVNWLLGAVEIYYTLIFLDRPVTWAEAWIIEAVAQMVRTGAFFIPAAIGVQEGAFLLICGAITGSAPIGVAVSVVRRIREIIWIAWGLLLSALYSLNNSKEG
jgi:uncharacterized protein (TIRG00374 family)